MPMTAMFFDGSRPHEELNIEGLTNFVPMGMLQVTEHFQFGGTKKHNLTTNREHISTSG